MYSSVRLWDLLLSLGTGRLGQVAGRPQKLIFFNITAVTLGIYGDLGGRSSMQPITFKWF